MRTISIRLDEQTDALLTAHCQTHALTQTDAIKAAIVHLADQHRPTPAELAAELGLIGGMRSGEGDLAQHHSQRVKQRLQAQRLRQAAAVRPSETASANPQPRKRRLAAA